MKNWKKVKLGSLLTESKIVSENPNTNKRLRVKLNVLGIEKRPITKDKKGATKYYIRKSGQFIYGKQNLHKGAFGIVPHELDGFESSSDIPAFDIDDSCHPEWIFYFFKKGNFYLKLETLAKGVGSKRINPKQIFELDIYLPTKQEQENIINEIHAAELNYKKLEKELLLQQKNLTKLRKSILQDAIRGKLTKDWRKQNQTIESINKLQKQIESKKKLFIKEKKIKIPKPLPKIQKEEFPFNIPVSWEWSRLKSIGHIIGGGTPSKRNFNYWNGNIPWISPKDMKRDYIYESQDYITMEGVNNSSANLIPEGSLLIVARSGILKRTIPIAINKVKCTVNQDLKVLIPYIPNMNEYIRLGLKGMESILLKDFVKYGMTVHSLKYSEFELLPFPLPPIEEQKEISKKVKKLNINCDNLENEINSNRENSEKLLQSIFSKLLGDENNVLVDQKSPKILKKNSLREIRYNSKTTLMDLVKLLKENGPLHAEDLWRMSKFPSDIDAFYAELKKQIEQEKTIKEGAEKGYLELV